MINIEKCALRPFKKNFFVALKCTMQKHNRIGDERAQFFTSRQITFVDLAKTDRLCTERLEDSIVLEDLGLQFFLENNRLHQIGHSQPGTRSLVPVSRSDPAICRSDFRPTTAPFALLI